MYIATYVGILTLLEFYWHFRDRRTKRWFRRWKNGGCFVSIWRISPSLGTDPNIVFKLSKYVRILAIAGFDRLEEENSKILYIIINNKLCNIIAVPRSLIINIVKST